MTKKTTGTEKTRQSARSKRILSRTPLFSGLPSQELSELLALAREIHLKRGELLFLEGDRAEHMFIILSGSVRAYRVNKQGREQIIHVESTGATLAEMAVFDDGPYPATAAAEEASIVLALHKDDFRAICFKHPAVAWAALGVLAGRLRRHAELVNALALQEVGPRLAKFLLAEARSKGTRKGTELHFTLSLSNQQLAARIGSVREVVSRTLTRLMLNGLLRLEGRHKTARGQALVIPDESAMQAYAGLN